MGVLLFATASGGLAVLGISSWSQAAKPWLRKKLASLVSSTGPKYLAGSRCSCEAVDVRLSCGKVDVCLKGLQVCNLEPYQSQHIISADSITVSVDVLAAAKSAAKNAGTPDKVEVVSVAVQGCSLILEKSGVFHSNIKDLLDKLHEEQGGPERKGQKMSVHVHKLTVHGTQLEATTTLQAQQNMRSLTVKVPDINVEDFSSKVQARSPAHIVKGLVDFILMAALSACGELNHIREAPAKVVEAVEETASSCSLS